ncbi:MAG: Nif11-like leader peptide family RiPP precursor [Clostridia bacterium]|nr:Nif11-like leader peptide family RiPP precursor [Clostridia bacterium]
MTENMKKFLEAVSQNEELAKKLSAMTMEGLLALAKELGVELTEADFEKPDGKLDENELEAVAGGGECYCAIGGGGTEDSNDKTCACVALGAGYSKYGDFSDPDYERCICGLAGIGVNN